MPTQPSAGPSVPPRGHWRGLHLLEAPWRLSVSARTPAEAPAGANRPAASGGGAGATLGAAVNDSHPAQLDRPALRPLPDVDGHYYSVSQTFHPPPARRPAGGPHRRAPPSPKAPRQPRQLSPSGAPQPPPPSTCPAKHHRPRDSTSDRFIEWTAKIPTRHRRPDFRGSRAAFILSSPTAPARPSATATLASKRPAHGRWPSTTVTAALNRPSRHRLDEARPLRSDPPSPSNHDNIGGALYFQRCLKTLPDADFIRPWTSSSNSAAPK